MAKIIDLDIVLPLIVEPVRPNTVEVGTPVVTNIGLTSFDVEQTFSSEVDYYGGIYVGESADGNDDATLVKNPGYLNKTITGLSRGTTYYVNGVALPIMGNINLGQQIAITTRTNPIPDEYQLVEYLQSTGTQYIDTESSPQLTTGFEIEYSFYQNNNENAVFGASTADSYSRGINYAIDRYTNSQYAYLGSSNYNIYSFLGFDVKHNVKFNLTGSDYIMYLNDTDIFIRNVVSVPNLNLFLFGRNFNGTLAASTPFSGKIYKFKLLNIGLTEKDLYSVYRKSDNKPGMYDIVNNVFYTNQGTGEFSVGPDKEWDEW